ncbi:MAG: DUF1501 domain-containing protein [Planctomycetota bacterium]
MNSAVFSRRHFTSMCSYSLASIAAAQLLRRDANAQEVQATGPQKPVLEPQHFDLTPKPSHHPARARAMISLFMIGGPSQIDMFDPKPELDKRDGQDFSADIVFDNKAEASRRLMKSFAKFHPRGASGIEMSELIPHMGEIADDITLVRSMHSDVNNHLPAINALQTGVGQSGEATLGSWLVQSLGCETKDLPAYVAMTHPWGAPLVGAKNWTSGKLPSIYSGTAVRPTEPRILNLDPPPHLVGLPQRLQLDFIKSINEQHLRKHAGNAELAARIESYRLAARMQTAAKEAFDISDEPKHIRELYGVDDEPTKDYGRRCLIARRLVERGVRFVQLFNNGQSWDHHDSIVKKLSQRCAEIDRPAMALVKDLKQRGMLEETIVHFGGEMGRLPVIQVPKGDNAMQRVGRDHNTFGFSQWMAGGGFKSGYVHGRTDDFAHHAVENVVTNHDYLATILSLFGLNHEQVKFQVGTREIALVPASSGKVCEALFA